MSLFTLEQNMRLQMKCGSPSSSPSNLRAEGHLDKDWDVCPSVSPRRVLSLTVIIKPLDVPEKKRTRTVPRTIMFAVCGTPRRVKRGRGTGLGASSAGPAAPLCAPQTDTRPAATFTAPTPPVRLFSDGKVPQVSNPQMEGRTSLGGTCRSKVRATEAASECV